MYVEDWDSFLQMSEALFRQAPLRTRYVLKYRHCDGKLVLKVTDDVAVSRALPVERPPLAHGYHSPACVFALRAALHDADGGGSHNVGNLQRARSDIGTKMDDAVVSELPLRRARSA